MRPFRLVSHYTNTHSYVFSLALALPVIIIKTFFCKKTRDLTDCLPPPRTLILDFTLTHTRFGKSQLSSLGQLTHTRRTDNVPEVDGPLKTVVRVKIRHYRQVYY
jgi:hypothetical protein